MENFSPDCHATCECPPPDATCESPKNYWDTPNEDEVSSSSSSLHAGDDGDDVFTVSDVEVSSLTTTNPTDADGDEDADGDTDARSAKEWGGVGVKIAKSMERIQNQLTCILHEEEKQTQELRRLVVMLRLEDLSSSQTDNVLLPPPSSTLNWVAAMIAVISLWIFF